MVTIAELAKHKSKDDLWVAVEGQVYNLTKFQDRHPGGANILNKVAGTDATKHFLKFHPTSVLRILEESEKLGPLEDSAPVEAEEEESAEDKQLALNRENMPALSEIYNLFDFEEVARHTLNRTGWYYYSSGADDEITLRENHRAFQRVWFRPKVLVDVTKVNFETTFLGKSSASPFYITATALARLGHPEGETVLTRAAHKKGIIQMVSTLSSCSVEEIGAARAPGQPFWMQVYVNEDRSITREFIQNAESEGAEAFFVTVDAPQLGRREKDMRSKYDEDLADVQGDDESDRNSGAARAISSFIDPGLSWKDIPFLRKCTKKPLCIKGIQRWEDAVRAAKLGINAIVLSNHGGRQLEFSRSALEVLAEVMPALRKRGLDRKIEVYIDGGVRRGTDVIKALCLGARGVGIGRPFLYALSTYGQAGAEKVIQLLNDEIEMNMRLLGVTSVDQLGPELIDVRNIGSHDAVPTDYSYEGVYERLAKPQFRNKL